MLKKDPMEKDPMESTLMEMVEELTLLTRKAAFLQGARPHWEQDFLGGGAAPTGSKIWGAQPATGCE